MAVRSTAFLGQAFVALCALVACGSDGDDPGPGPGEELGVERSTLGCGVTDFSVCGYPLDTLEDVAGERAYTAPFRFVLEDWGELGRCRSTVVRGECADGKAFLIRNEGMGTEVRYFDGQTPVGVVRERADAACGDPCPYEDFYGTLESVACESPSFGVICNSGALGTQTDDFPVGFRDGRPLKPCMACEP
jgi:hypothetical protein